MGPLFSSSSSSSGDDDIPSRLPPPPDSLRRRQRPAGRPIEVELGTRPPAGVVAPATPRRQAPRAAAATTASPGMSGLTLGTPTTYVRPSGDVIRVTPVPLPVLPGRAFGRSGAAPAPAAAAPVAATPSRSPRGRARTATPRRERRPRQVVGSGATRETPCLRCVRSALRGRSHGVCEEVAGDGSRCVRCAHGHSCQELPADARRASRALRDALVARAPAARIAALRTTVRTLLELSGAGEEEEEEEEEEEWAGFA
ncbi:hypothetical protein F5B21DRAFT_510256 [Xylaria acuta]|nr:hypothetical protein F5B21DRAFT_510256 [Xylaria acuta]